MSDKIKTSIECIDHIFDGGLPQKGIVILTGQCGVGKTSLLLGLGSVISTRQLKCLYVTTEQTLLEIKKQFKSRICKNESLFLCAEKNLAKIINLIKKHRPSIVLLDSICGLLDDKGYALQRGYQTHVVDTLRKLSNDVGFICIITDHAVSQIKYHDAVDTILVLSANQKSRSLRSVKNRFSPKRAVTFEIDEFIKYSSHGNAKLSNKGSTNLFEIIAERFPNVIPPFLWEARHGQDLPETMARDFRNMLAAIPDSDIDLVTEASQKFLIGVDILMTEFQADIGRIRVRSACNWIVKNISKFKVNQ